MKTPFKLRSGNKPSIAKLSGISPLKDAFVKVGKKGKKIGVGPFEEKQSLRSRGRKLVNKGMEIGGALGDEIFEQGDKLVEKSYRGTIGGFITTGKKK
tara:strand:+ start:41 stop:334 length:294 start_codon:yes stop_codon:yes gene_type:complete